MFKYLSKVEYKLFGLIIFYAISTSLFVVSPFMQVDRTGFKTQDGFNEIALFLSLFLLINLVITFIIFFTEKDSSKKIIIIGIIVFLFAIIFALCQWGFIILANPGPKDSGTNVKLFNNFIFPLFLNIILITFFNEFLKWIIIATNRNKPAKCFIVSNSLLFLSKNKYLIINNTVLLTFNKWHQIDIIIFEQFEDEILDFGGEEKTISKKVLDKNTKDLLDDFIDEKIKIITKPTKNAQDLLDYIKNISKKVESPVLCILTNSGIYLPTLKGKIPNYIKYVKKTYIDKKIKDNLMKGTELSFLEITEKI